MEEEQEKRTKVLFVTGPRAAGRLGLVSSLNGRKDGLGRLMSRVKFLTPDPIAPQRNPERYTLVSEENLESMRQSGAIVYEGVDKTAFGIEVPVAISSFSLRAPADEGLLVVDGEPRILDSLRTRSDLVLSPVWISLQTKEQFIEKASSIVKVEFTEGRRSRADQAADKVSNLVDEAARDITFYMQKALSLNIPY